MYIKNDNISCFLDDTAFLFNRCGESPEELTNDFLLIVI